MECRTFLTTANYQLKSHNSLRTNHFPRPLIRAGKIVIYDIKVQSQITFFVSAVMLKLTRSVKGHLATVIEVGMHVTERNPEHVSLANENCE